MVYLAFVVTAAYHGTGQHATHLPPAEIPIGLKVGRTSKIERIMQADMILVVVVLRTIFRSCFDVYQIFHWYLPRSNSPDQNPPNNPLDGHYHNGRVQLVLFLPFYLTVSSIGILLDTVYRR